MTIGLWQIVGIVLGSNVLVEVIKALSAKQSEQRKRKATLEDLGMAKADKTKTLEERFDAFCEVQQAENRELRQRLSGVESTLGTLCDVTSIGEYNSMRKEALLAIRANRVDVEDRAELLERYERYKKISHRHDLDHIMEELSSVPPKIDE